MRLNTGDTTMLRQLHTLTIPIAISIAFFDATFFVIASVFGFNGREVTLGVVAGAAGGMCVLVAVLWEAARNGAADSPLAKEDRGSSSLLASVPSVLASMPSVFSSMAGNFKSASWLTKYRNR
jgi:hypothetical protein